MSKTGKPNYRRGSRGTPKPERIVTVRSVRRDPPDLRKLSRAVIAIALRDAEAQAEARDAMRGTALSDNGSTVLDQTTIGNDHPEPANG